MRHALIKLDIVAGRGFVVDLDRIAAFVQNPREVRIGRENRLTVHLPLDDDHILRVVYEEE